MKPQILSTPIANAEPLPPFLNSTHESPRCERGLPHTHSPAPAHDRFREGSWAIPTPPAGGDSSSCSRSNEPEPPKPASPLAPDPHSPHPSTGPSVPSCKNIPVPPVKQPGRPTLFTDALVDKICDYIQNCGVSDSAAGLLSGVSTSTLSRWKAENPDFALLLEAARAELQRELITAVREARRRDGSSDWRGAAWLLERLFPEDFGRRPRSNARSRDQDPNQVIPTAGSAPVVVPAPARAAQATAAESAPTVESTAALDQAPRFPKPVPPAPPEPRFPKPTAPEPSAQISPQPIPSDAANIPETPVLPLPGRFRCPRLSNRAVAAVRDRGAEPAEFPQLFPKDPASTFPPFQKPDPSIAGLFPKLHLNRPPALTGPIMPPVISTASATGE